MRVVVVGRDATRVAMAQGWLRALGSEVVEARVEVAGAPDPDAVAVMAEVGVDLRVPAAVEGGSPDVIVTFAELEDRSLGDAEVVTWGVSDPAATAPDQRRDAFRRTRDDLRDRVRAFVAARGLAPAFGNAIKSRFALDPHVTFLNHGSFGATPLEVLDARHALSLEFEREPVQYVVRVQPRAMRAAAERVGAFLGLPADELVFVDNATAGANAVLRSLRFAPGDAIVTTDHTYHALRRLFDWVAARYGARVVPITVPFPLASPSDVVDAVRAGFPADAKLAVFDHVTSATGLLFPVERLVELCRERGVPVLLDGAHVPGMVVSDIGAIGADFWTGNLHKWAFAPKGCAVLHVRRPWHAQIRPPVLSLATTGPALHDEFDYQGTRDPAVFLASEAGLRFGEAIGWDRLRAHNHLLRKEVGEAWLQRFGLTAPAPESMLAGLHTLPLPPGVPRTAAALHRRLFDDRRIEAMFPVFHDETWFRISPQIYNEAAEYGRLADALVALPA